METYIALHPRDHPSSIMVAFNEEREQIGWTLMLGPSTPVLDEQWACPVLCGPRTGLIGCVGVDKPYRATGVGLAMLCHAIEDMEARGIEGVFVDWVSMNGYYEKVGFHVWRSYRPGNI